MIACDPGTYGAGCNEICGHCFQKDTCLHTNGTCAEGCAPGYTGELCKACKLIFVSYSIGVKRYFNIDISWSISLCLNNRRLNFRRRICLKFLYFFVTSLEYVMENMKLNEWRARQAIFISLTHIKWRLQICNHFIAGSIGTDGIDCNEIYGHCLNKENCFNVNCTGLSGCASGYFRRQFKIRTLY